jgi:hypothetical protein
MRFRERLRRWRKAGLSEEEREERGEATARLASALRDEIRRRFPEAAMEFPETAIRSPRWAKDDVGEELVVNIACPSGGVGDLTIVADDSEATLYVEGMAAHEHFTAYGPVDPDVYEAASKAERDEFVVTGCCDFLERVFGDEVVFWAAPDGYGGWHSRDSPHTGGITILLTGRSPSGPRSAWTWSGPYPASEEEEPETRPH